MFSRFIKRCWKNAPPFLQLMVLRLLLFMRLSKRDGTTSGEGPLYVVGSLRSATGIGYGARLYINECKKQGKSVYAVDVTREMLQQAVLPQPADTKYLGVGDLISHGGGGTIIIHANPPLFNLLLPRLPKAFLQNKRLVAYWAWELERLPKSYIYALPYIDAVEVPSNFIADAVRFETDKDVTVKPHSVPLPPKQKTSFCSDGVLHCLYILDMASGYERKNPEAAINAFSRAFPNGQGVCLTIKVSQHIANPKAFRELCDLAKQNPSVHIMTGWQSAEDLDELYLQNDVYLSTHRSEGYGLTIREAMNHGLYVVATGWSGNMDFMQGERAIPLPYTLVPAPSKFAGQNQRIMQWAEVDIEQTAKALQQLKSTLLDNMNCSDKSKGD